MARRLWSGFFFLWRSSWVFSLLSFSLFKLVISNTFVRPWKIGEQFFYISFATTNFPMEPAGGLPYLSSAEQGQDWGIIFVVLSAQSECEIMDVLGCTVLDYSCIKFLRHM